MDKPLSKLTFCCTGIPASDRKRIHGIITDLGGVHYSDLMSDVQYLIVGSKTTDKYIYCVKNRMDMVFLRNDAIDRINSLWQKQHSFSLHQFRLPIFSNVSICLSRINYDPKESSFTGDNLKKIIDENGGAASSSLVAQTDCLVTNEDSGRRYVKALEWNIPVVHPLWVKHSLARKASVDVQDYLLSNYPNYPSLKQPRKLKSDNSIWDSLMSKPIVLKESALFNQWDDSVDTDPLEVSEVSTAPVAAPSDSDLFKNLRFRLFGFNNRQTKILTRVIANNGGLVVDSTASYLLIPFGHSLPSFEVSMPIRTEWFIERSIYYKKVVDDEWSEPTEVCAATSDAKFTVSLSGFKGIELLHLTQLAKRAHFDVSDSFNAQVHLLVVNINMFRTKMSDKLFYNKTWVECEYNSVNLLSTKNKINAAKKWKIPVVSSAYMFEVARGSSERLQLPDLRDLHWCLYAPSESSGLLQYADEPDTASVSDSVPVASPTKPKQKRKYGKLVVTGDKALNLETSEVETVSFDEDQVAIGYKTDTSALLSKLKRHKS